MVPPLLLNPGEMSDPNRVIPTPKKKKAADDCRLLAKTWSKINQASFILRVNNAQAAKPMPSKLAVVPPSGTPT